MLVKQYIKDFEAMGFGIFTHFGIYSVLGKGEWAKSCHFISDTEYEALATKFHPAENWAEELVLAAKDAGAKYITLTARHHDGYSLYDTRGLSDFDAQTHIGRDLVREFVDACNVHGIKPFFYHTLLDWHMPTYKTDFSSYLRYLRESVEILCTNYGKIGGIWFDGSWDKPDADWEQDELYSLIRRYQPDAMIINNTGMDARGALGHIELDSVTFERGKPMPINLSSSPKYIASEMCQVLNNHWGYAENDLAYSSTKDIISELAECRRTGANYLLNVGPMKNGILRTIDRGILEVIGKWVRMNEEALRTARPSNITVLDHPEDFALRKEDSIYLFIRNAPDCNQNIECRVIIGTNSAPKSAVWLDNAQPLPCCHNADHTQITLLPMDYGTFLPVRIIKLEI